ncbi:hypothetical protein ACJMK2_044051 [Sinanodonta woodiana]|uniref:Uncharacterized protein n=1 Tax=Sinanodonta woodiana TaxID=1069815 RepID=A0ABD3W0K2_SINWO
MGYDKKRKSSETVDEATPAKFPRLFKYKMFVIRPLGERDNNCFPGIAKDYPSLASSAVISQHFRAPLNTRADCAGIENVKVNTQHAISCNSFRKKNNNEDANGYEIPRRRKIPMRTYEKPSMDEKALPSGFNFWNDKQENKGNREKSISSTFMNEANTPMEVEKPWDQVDSGYNCINFWRTELPNLTPEDLQCLIAPLS